MIDKVKLLLQLKHDNRAATAIEYGLIAALVGIVIVTGATILGTTLSDAFSSVAGSIDTALE